MTVGIFVVVYSWVDPINTTCSSAHHDCQQMLNGAILPGEQHFSEERWVNNILNKCHFNNCLWGYTIRNVEELRTCDPAVFTDGVLYNLMRMGVMDWTGENAQGNQSTQAMRLATVLVSRLIQITNADRANMSV